ncbi:MAG: hypothetical protein ACE5GK_10855 [Nitrospiria bacterium]
MLKPTEMTRFGLKRPGSWKPSWVIFLFLFFFPLSFSACGDISGSAPSDEDETFTFGGTLYVTNEGDGSLLAFHSQDPSLNKSVAKAAASPIPRLQEGNIAPDRRFPEALGGPAGMFLDRGNDILYVANTAQNAILIYEKASTLKPPVKATRVIAGNLTRLDRPFGVAFDKNTNRLWVANRDANAVLLFDVNCDGATTALAGNIAPCRLLILDGVTLPNFPRDVAIDTGKNILYVSTAGNDSILIYDNAGTIGGPPSSCTTDLSACSQAPARIISPHSGTEDVSKLELPFGIYIDEANDRLYVANTGLNIPAIFIYENASTRNGGVVPERVIADGVAGGLSTRLTQLTVPAGIDVDVATGRLSVVNNNSPNNVNVSSGNNVESPSLVVFRNIDTACPLSSAIPCEIAPDIRIGGDVGTSPGTTLSSPIGVAYDAGREITYIANTGGNNVLYYALDGNIAPIEMNAGIRTTPTQAIPGDDTGLEEPSAFFYDADLDRLYVANFGTSKNIPVLVYEKASTLSFNNTPPSWTIADDPINFVRNMRGIHIDKQRGYLLVLNAAGAGSRFSVYCIPDSNSAFNSNCPSAQQWSAFPTNGPIAPPGTTTLSPVPPALISFSFSGGGPTAMAVDPGRGMVYVADKTTIPGNKISVYTLGPPTSPTFPAFLHDITGAATGLNQPHGLAVDASRDRLFVTNAGNNSIVSFDLISTKTGGNLAPDRTFTTTTLPEADKLKTPIAPQIDEQKDQLLLISADQDAIFIYDDASTLGGEKAPDKKISGSNALFDFKPPLPLFNITGALLFTEMKGTKTIFVGQPESPTCDKAQLLVCPRAALLVFGVQGKVVPSRIWTGGAGAFSTPAGVGVDPIRDVLYVVNQPTNTLSRLKNASQVDVTLDPSSGKTDLTSIQLNAPSGLFADAANNRLYISNSGDNRIRVFDNADTFPDSTAPSATLSHAQLNDPRGLTVDTARSRLYVASRGNNAVVAGSTTALDTVISGPNTRLNQPIDVAVDASRDLLYVLNDGATEVLVFEGISTLNGNAAPARIITGGDIGGGNDFMVDPSALFVDPVLDLLYVADRGAASVYFFLDASRATGQAEHKTLSGDNTGLNKPSALFVDIAGSP